MLEHLKYDNFTRALEEIRKVLKEDGVLILSLPDGGLTFKLDIKLPKVKTWHVKKICKYYKKDFRFTGEHYWEVNGSRKCLAKTVRNLIQSQFVILDEYTCRFNSYHRFYICKVYNNK